MKKIQKLFCLLLSLAMMLCFAVPAYATDPTTYDLKINSQTPGHTYQAYQIFGGDLATVPGSTDINTLVNIVWGDGIQEGKQGALLTAIQGIVTGSAPTTTPFKNCKDAADVADVLAENRNTPALVDAFAAVVGTKDTTGYTYLDDTNKKEDSIAAEATAPYSATIKDLPAGYYLIKEAEFEPENTNNAYTKYMLTVVQLTADQEIDAKADVPTLDKKVAVGNVTADDETTATIGDTVTYTLTSEVPKMEGYNKYFFVIEDTLSEGLKLDPESITVKISTSPEETTLEKDVGYTVTTNPATVPEPEDNKTTSLKIVFTNFIQYNTTDYIGKNITVTYEAEVNKNALSGLDPTTNRATLTYSNDPNFTYKGKDGSPDEPDGDEPTGKTPPDVADVYTASIQINKTDKAGYPLTGAGFTLQYKEPTTEPADTKAIVTTYARDAFTEDNTYGTYYKLTNGAFTTKAPEPDGSTDSLYDSTTTKYKKDDTQATKTEPDTVTKEMVGADGVLQLSGLKAGTYILTETITPTNYNTVDPITLTLTFTPADEEKGTAASWSGKYQIGEDEAEDLAVENGVLSITVVNHAGMELPSTGGMGTTLFLYGGAGLMILALVLLVVRKKKNHDGE